MVKGLTILSGSGKHVRRNTKSWISQEAVQVSHSVTSFAKKKKKKKLEAFYLGGRKV